MDETSIHRDENI